MSVSILPALPSEDDRPIAWGRAWTLAVGFAAAYLVQAVAGYAFTSISGGLAAIWLGNGLLAGALLLLPKRLGAGLFAFAVATDLWSALAVGRVPPDHAAIVVVMDQVEALIAALLAARIGGGSMDPTKLRRIAPLLALCAAPATVFTGTVGALLAHGFGTSSVPNLWAVWVAGDLMGMTLSLPATLILARPGRYLLRAEVLDWKNLATLAGVIALSLALSFLPGPRGASLLIVLAAFLAAIRLPPVLIVAMNMAIATIGTLALLYGFGPSARWPGAEHAQFLLLQLLLLPIVICTLLTSAMVSDRTRQERHLRRALAAAKAARNKAVAANGVKARFLAAISHEMRTPLNSIMGNAELLDRTADLPAAEVRRVQAIRASGETLAELIDDVLDFTQIDTGRIEIHRDDLDLTAICREALIRAQTLADGKPIEFKLSIAPDVATPRIGDARRIQQMLRQLLGNAIKFTPVGVIELDVRLDGGQVLFAVSDTGVGIDCCELPRVFQPFCQGDETTTRRFGGAGLGLAITRGIVDAMGGEAGVESRFGYGSRFWFRLPLEASHRARSTASVVCLPAVDAPLRALVVDDHPVNRDLAATFMQALGFEVVCADDGRQAVEAMKSGWFDVVLMDLHMPVMDGLEATRAIRALAGARGQTPIVALTASASDEAIEECRRAGMNGHLAKPIRGEALAVALQEALAT